MQREEAVLLPKIHQIDNTVPAGLEHSADLVEDVGKTVDKGRVVDNAAEITRERAVVARRAAVGSTAPPQNIPVGRRSDAQPYGVERKVARKHASIRGDHAVRPLGPAERRRGQASARQGDCSLRQVEADPSVPKGGSSQECGTRTAERIENRARTRRQQTTDHTVHKLFRKYSRIVDTGLRGRLPEVSPYRNGVAEPVTTGERVRATGRNQARSHQQEGCRRGDKEGARDYTLSGRVALTPSVEIGLRHDRSDAKNGAGTEVGSGLVVSDQAGGLSLDMRNGSTTGRSRTANRRGLTHGGGP